MVMIMMKTKMMMAKMMMTMMAMIMMMVMMMVMMMMMMMMVMMMTMMMVMATMRTVMLMMMMMMMVMVMMMLMTTMMMTVMVIDVGDKDGGDDDEEEFVFVVVVNCITDVACFMMECRVCSARGLLVPRWRNKRCSPKFEAGQVPFFLTCWQMCITFLNTCQFRIYAGSTAHSALCLIKYKHTTLNVHAVCVAFTACQLR